MKKYQLELIIDQIKNPCLYCIDINTKREHFPCNDCKCNLKENNHFVERENI